MLAGCRDFSSKLRPIELLALKQESIRLLLGPFNKDSGTARSSFGPSLELKSLQPANRAEKSTKLSGHKEKIQAVTQELRKSINLHTNRRKRKVSPVSNSAKPLKIQRQNYAGLAHCSFNCLFFKEQNCSFVL